MSGSESQRASKRPMALELSLRQQPHTQATPPPSHSHNMLFRPVSSSATVAPHLRHRYRPITARVNPELNMNLPPATSPTPTPAPAPAPTPTPAPAPSVPEKKKRGRPKTYKPKEASSSGMPLAFVPGPPPAITVSQPTRRGSREKKVRGNERASGSSTQSETPIIQSSAGPTVVGFTPQFLTALPGEDISAKIMAFAQNGPRAVCVMSANGALSSVTLCNAVTTGGTVTFEGRFDILSLLGSFHLMEHNGRQSRSGCLTVSLSSPEGSVFGGNVAGPLIAASPVQMVIGTFIPDGQKEPNQPVGQLALTSPTVPTTVVPTVASTVVPTVAPTMAPTQVLTTPSSSQSRGTMTESSRGGGGGSLPQQSTGGPHIISLPWK